jgi:hypothetical protein
LFLHIHLVLNCYKYTFLLRLSHTINRLFRLAFSRMKRSKIIPTGEKKLEALVYLANNSFLCTAFAQSLSGHQERSLVCCVVTMKQFNNKNNGFN